MCTSSWATTLFQAFWMLAALPRGLTFEWTALGDSYASGVGAGNYIGGQRCFRYDQAYPVQANGSSRLPQQSKFNNNPCSGAEIQDVLKYQLEDGPTQYKPNWQYGDRPGFGNPNMAVLQVGGDDIDFPGILFNCILETSLLAGGPTSMPCVDQLVKSNVLLASPLLEIDLADAIQQIVTKGRSKVGNSFKLILLGYAQFFNADDPGCDSVTFAVSANPKPDGKPHNYLNTTFRAQLNQMSLSLNNVIKNAVSQTANLGVTYIDVEQNNALDGHRFCEPGIKEPDPSNPNLWFYHYPYKQPKTAPAVFSKAVEDVFQNFTMAQLNAKYPNTSNLIDAQYEAFFNNLGNQTGTNGTGELYSPWSSIFGNIVRSFHPQIPFHSHMRDQLLDEMLSTANPAPIPTPTPTPTPITCPGNFSSCGDCPNGIDTGRGCSYDGEAYNDCFCAAPCGDTYCIDD